MPTLKKIAIFGTALLLASAMSGQEVNARVESVDPGVRSRVQDPDRIQKPSLPASTEPSTWETHLAAENDANRKGPDSGKRTRNEMQPGMSNWVGSAVGGPASSYALRPQFLGTAGQRNSPLKSSTLSSKQKSASVTTNLEELESRNLRLGTISEDAVSSQQRNSLGELLRGKLVTAKRVSQRARHVNTTTLPAGSQTQPTGWGTLNTDSLTDQRDEAKLRLLYGYGDEFTQKKEEQKQRRLDRKARQARRNKMKIVRH